MTNLIFHNEGGKQTYSLLHCNVYDVTVVSRRYVDLTMGRLALSSKNARVCWLKGKMKTLYHVIQRYHSITS